MNINRKRLANIRKAFNSIVFGTAAGLLTYAAFLYFHIAIFGWNLGLLFAPLVSGYAETALAKKLLGENIGAISAFILFIVTVVHGFIIDNPTLGVNVITIGSIIIIIQSAVPTLINYFLIVVVTGTLSYLTGFFKKITDSVYDRICELLNISRDDIIDIDTGFSESESNELINSQKFIFITSTDTTDKKYTNLGYFYATKMIEKSAKVVITSPKDENQVLKKLKSSKDECLIRLADEIKSNGGNGVIDLEINYFLNGVGGSNFQVIARGMGVRFTG